MTALDKGGGGGDVSIASFHVVAKGKVLAAEHLLSIPVTGKAIVSHICSRTFILSVPTLIEASIPFIHQMVNPKCNISPACCWNHFTTTLQTYFFFT